MLKLTVLRRRTENGVRICEIMAIIQIDFKERQCNGIVEMAVFKREYSKEKQIILKYFTSKMPLKRILKKIQEKGLKVAEPKFKNSSEIAEIVLLIDS